MDKACENIFENLPVWGWNDPGQETHKRKHLIHSEVAPYCAVPSHLLTAKAEIP